MNKFIKIVAVLLLLPLSVLVPTLSLESYYAPTTSAQTATDAKLEERKKLYKAALAEELTSAVQQRLKLRCLAVQTNLKALDARLGTSLEKRGEAYDRIIAKLDDIIVKLKAQEIDTAKLEAVTAELKTKVAGYDKSVAEYSQTVGDLTVIDCTQDPTSFKGALETARNDQVDLISMVADIRGSVANTIKPELQAVKAALEAVEAAEKAKATETNETTDNTTESEQ